MNKKGQRLCVWSGILSIVVFFIGFWPMAHFMPPLSPSMTGQELADFYLNNSVGVRMGAICICLSAGLLVAFYTEITVQISRIEGRYGPLSLSQMAVGVLAVVPFIPAAVAMCVITYRPDRDLATILMLSDCTWILLFMVAAPAMVQFFILGYAILTDTNSTPIFPRWMGYFTFWCAVLGIPGNVIVFFYGGPFSWAGLFGYWIPASLFGMWTFAMAWLLFKAIDNETTPT